MRPTQLSPSGARRSGFLGLDPQLTSAAVLKLSSLVWWMGCLVMSSACYAAHAEVDAPEPEPAPACSEADGECGRPDEQEMAPYCAHPLRPPRIDRCDPGVSDVDRSCARPAPQATYESCATGQDVCSADPDAKCAAYTDNPANSFCAAYCESDDDCPTLPGFKAACNLAWCALLCAKGRCPDDMVCVRDLHFRDCVAADRGFLSVCVPSL